MNKLERGKRYSGNQIINLIGFRSFQDFKASGRIEKVGITEGSNIYIVKY